MRSSESWPSYYREAIQIGGEREDPAAARNALLSVFTENVRALEELPQEEQERFLALCRSSEEEPGILVDDNDSVPTAATALRLGKSIPAVVALAIVAIAIAAAIEMSNQRRTDRVTFAPLPPPARYVPARAPVKRIHIAARRAPATGARALPAARIATPIVAPEISHRLASVAHRAPSAARVTPHRERRIAFVPRPRVLTPTMEPPRELAPGTSAEGAIAGLYADANPDADVLSVAIVRDSPTAVVADVTSREDSATIVDRLTLAPRGRSLELVATERLTQGSQSARACYERGMWKPCQT